MTEETADQEQERLAQAFWSNNTVEFLRNRPPLQPFKVRIHGLGEAYLSAPEVEGLAMALIEAADFYEIERAMQQKAAKQGYLTVCMKRDSLGILCGRWEPCDMHPTQQKAVDSDAPGGGA